MWQSFYKLLLQWSIFTGLFVVLSLRAGLQFPLSLSALPESSLIYKMLGFKSC